MQARSSRNNSHFCTEVLRAPYLRYVDDFVLFHDDPVVLAHWRERIARFLEGRRLIRHPRKTVILPTAEPTDFLGYTLLAGGRRRLPEAAVARFRRRLRSMRDRLAAGKMAPADAERRIRAWDAHAAFADTASLRQAILGDLGSTPAVPLSK